MARKANELDCCVYAHISPSNKIYIGITGMRLKERWNDGRGYKKCPFFWKAIQKYGWDNFKHIVLIEHVHKEIAGECEKFLISKYRTNEARYGYNNSSGGDKGNPGYQLTEEQLKHRSEVSLGRKLSDETKKKIGAANSVALKGKKIPEEVRRKISESNKGKNSNKHPSLETRMKNSQAHLGKQYHLGFKHSEESRRKMSESRKQYLAKLKSQGC